MLHKKIYFLILFFISCNCFAQTCDCKKEFLHIKNFMEVNYVGFNDKIKLITQPVYNKRVNELQQLTAKKNANEKCLLIIATYLQAFRDAHVGVKAVFDATVYDSGYIASRERMDVSEKQLASLKNSIETEGIYYYRPDSSYKVAVFKNPNMLRDYVAIIVESKNPQWKRGMVKFEFKKQFDGEMAGVLYMRNHMPKIEWFAVGENTIGGDWQREGSKIKSESSAPYEPVSSRRLSDKTLYIKIATFGASNADRIDSVVKANKSALDTLPNLVLDLRDNGGGADFAYAPLVPYMYTDPIKSIGVDVLSTDSSIAGWRRLLQLVELPQSTKDNISAKITLMEANKGKLVNIVKDETDSSYTATNFPKKIVILVNENCASTTEQFLFAAKQSKKVIVAGNRTGGVLDYSNVRESNFPCMPYVLAYSSTRSRRIEAGQAIDNIGIRPDIYFDKNKDWIKEVQWLLENNTK